jgi:hypothetical protein
MYACLPPVRLKPFLVIAVLVLALGLGACARATYVDKYGNIHGEAVD